MSPRQRKTPLARGSRPTPKLRIEPMLVEALAAPLPLELLTESLGRQPELVAPAKLVLSSTGEPGVLAEVQHAGGDRACNARAHEAIDRALTWLEQKLDPPDRNEAHAGGESLPQWLESLPWAWERCDDGSYHVNATGTGVSCRVRVESVANGWLQASTSSALKVESVGAAETLPIFALEANRRIRIARVSVGAIHEGTVSVAWDAMVPTEPDPDHALPRAVAAVVVARTETARALRALGVPGVARAYLNLRAGTPALRGYVRSD